MIILRKYKMLLQVTGLALDPHGGCKNVIARIVFSILYFLFNLLSIIFLALTFGDNLEQTLLLMLIIFSHLAIIPSYFHMVINRKQFHSLLDELHDIVQESKDARSTCLGNHVMYADFVGTRAEEINREIYARAAQDTKSAMRIVMTLFLVPIFL